MCLACGAGGGSWADDDESHGSVWCIEWVEQSCAWGSIEGCAGW